MTGVTYENMGMPLLINKVIHITSNRFTEFKDFAELETAKQIACVLGLDGFDIMH